MEGRTPKRLFNAPLPQYGIKANEYHIDDDDDDGDNDKIFILSLLIAKVAGLLSQKIKKYT